MPRIKLSISLTTPKKRLRKSPILTKSKEAKKGAKKIAAVAATKAAELEHVVDEKYGGKGSVYRKVKKAATSAAEKAEEVAADTYETVSETVKENAPGVLKKVEEAGKSVIKTVHDYRKDLEKDQKEQEKKNK